MNPPLMNGENKPPSLRVSLYHRLVAGTVLIVILLAGVLYWHDFNDHLDSRLSADKQEVVLRAYMVDFLLMSTENRAIGLQKLALGNAPVASHSPYLPDIIRQLAKPGQQPVTFDSPVPSDGRGNMLLTHQPPTPGLAQEIGIALGLTPMFDVIINNTPGIIATYYLSAHQFIYLQHELDIARNVQRSTLPRQTFQSSELEIAGVMMPAKEVCGDGYDYFPVDERRVAIFIADVSGKGMSAAIYMSGVRMLLRALAPTCANAADCLEQANRILSADNEEMMFATLFLGFLDQANGEMNFANAGHPPPILIGSDGKATPLQGIKAPALGPFTGVVYPSQTYRLTDGERLLLYTDGITEAFSLNGGIFGLDRLLIIRPSDSEDNEAWLERIVASVGIFAEGAGQSDDITCLAARFHAPRLFDLTVPCIAKASIQLSNAITQWANTSGLTTGQTQRAAIVLDELFSNAVRHGVEPTHDNGAVWIRLNAWQGLLIGQFRSPGPPFDPNGVETPDLSPALEMRTIGGLGLHIVRKLTQSFHWRYIEETNVFDFTIGAENAFKT